MSLQTKLDAYRVNWERRVGKSISCLVDDDIEGMCCAFQLAQTPKPGDNFPLSYPLYDANNVEFDLESHATGKTLVVKIYRGGWCPYCRIDLRAFEALVPALAKKNAAVIAISPELPKYMAETIADNDVSFPVLSDKGGALMAALGIRVVIESKVAAWMEKSGINLKERHGSTDWFLPAPSVFVLSPDRTIAHVFISPDFRERVDPEKIVELV